MLSRWHLKNPFSFILSCFSFFCARSVICAFILWRHLSSSCCLHLVLPSTIDFNGLQISFSGFLPEPFKISKNGFLHITLHTSAQNILKLQVPRSKALGGVWTESSKIRAILYYYRLYNNFRFCRSLLDPIALPRGGCGGLGLGLNGPSNNYIYII